MSFFDTLEKSSATSATLKWKGTFREYLNLWETKKFPNLGDTAHQRIEKMILAAGTEIVDYFGHKRTKYKFFEDYLFGAEQTVDEFMCYIHAAARRTETSRRMVLLYGPPSTGKSEICTLIKRGLEAFSKTDEGAVFALAGSKMNENPFLLIPNENRKEFEDRYGIQIEGRLNPLSQWRLDNEFNGKFLDFPIERVFLSEASRVGIGTFLPSEPKSQDQTELTGSIDFAKIQEVGDEADPRAFNFNGELNVANRGMMEMIEALRSDERFLRVLLTATQEKQIKAPRFGLIFVDTCIILHSNEEEFKIFMGDERYRAYRDRSLPIRAPYNLSASKEVKIYEKLLSQSDIKDCSIAPHTLTTCGIISTLSRLDSQKDADLSLVKKMKLYDGQNVKGHKVEQAYDMLRKNNKEGMNGISPRFMIDQVNVCISKAIEEDRKYITALDVMRQITSSINSRELFTAEEKNAYKEIIDLARQEFNDLLRNDIQRAFFLSFEQEAKALCDTYLDHIEASLSGKKPRDPITHEEVELDENLMDSIESHLDVSRSGKDDFRNEICRFFGSAARAGKRVDYSEHATLRDAIQKQLFRERQNVIRLTVSNRNPDPDGLRRINEVVDCMVKRYGYTAESSNELLKYATAHLFEKK